MYSIISCAEPSSSGSPVLGSILSFDGITGGTGGIFAVGKGFYTRFFRMALSLRSL